MLNINVTIIYQFRILWFTFIPPKYINHIACHNLNLLNPHNNNVVRIKSSHSNHSITALIYSISFSMVMLLLS